MLNCPECGLAKGHKTLCETGKWLAMRRQQPESVDLDALRHVSVAEIAKGPNKEWNHHAKAPELFTQWWKKHGDHKWTARKAARAAWYACAKSLGVYDDQEAGESQ